MSKKGVSDMTLLSDLSEKGICSNLATRYKQDLIYCWIGNVLVSTNPFKNIKGLYSEQQLRDYQGKYSYEMPPHIYALSDQVYRQLLQEGHNQCVIVSGESGAGKTEACKQVLQFIAAISSNSDEVMRVKSIILESNPLLEAFGNAKTVRNNNSSRFGKWLQIAFSAAGDPEGGRVTNYLLEKSRVVFQGNSERNFHIFYQLLAGADAQMRQEYGLRSAKEYHYLNQGNCFKVDNINDEKEYQDTVRAMGIMGLTAQQQTDIWKTLAGILSLGNIQFAQNEKDEAYITNTDELEWFSHLLGVDQTVAQNGLCLRTIESGSRRASVFKCPQDIVGATYARDALAKELYSRLFDFIVESVNVAFQGGKRGGFGDKAQIGLLDIFGFEIFDCNGFEQLCINYVNEKLQQVFIELTLKQEQEEYAREGIQWTPIKYFDNAVVVDLIEGRQPIGIFRLLDDVCNFPQGSDQKFHGKLGQQFDSHAHFSYGTTPTSFVVKHYAGEVQYEVEGFLDKNKDLLLNDLIDLASQAQNPLVHKLFPMATQSNDRKRPTTASHKIKTSINELVKELKACTPSYIRTLKPNDDKRADHFEQKRVLHQIKYLGLLENVRVRRAGFAYRHPFKPFFYRYRVLCDQTWPTWSGDDRSGAVAICKQMGFEEGKDFQLGSTKLFVRAPESVFALEERRERTVHSHANTIQRFFLQFAMQSFYYDLQMSCHANLQGKKQRRRLSLQPHKLSGDYIGFRDNHELRKVVSSAGSKKEKARFAGMGTKYDRRGKSRRDVVIVTEEAFYEVALEKNDDKEKRDKKPYVYVLKRRVKLSDIRGITMSPYQDGYCVFNLPEYDLVIDVKLKTEMVGMIKHHMPSCNISFASNLAYALKENKKNTIQWAQGGMLANGELKKKGGLLVTVAPGEDAGSTPNVTKPASMPQVSAPRNAISSRPAAPMSAPRPAAPVSAPPPARAAVSPRPGPKQPVMPRPGPKKAVMPRPGPKKAGMPRPGPKKGPGPKRKFAPKKKGSPFKNKGVRKGGPQKHPFKKQGPKKWGPKKAGGARGAPPRAPVGKGRIKVLWAFEALNAGELTVQAGATGTLLDDRDAEWWKVQVGGATGIVPKSYMEKL